MRPLIPLFSRYLLNTYWVLVTLLSVGDKAVTKATSSVPTEPLFRLGKADGRQVDTAWCVLRSMPARKSRQTGLGLALGGVVDRVLLGRMSEEVSRAGPGCSGDVQAEGITSANDWKHLEDRTPVRKEGGQGMGLVWCLDFILGVMRIQFLERRGLNEILKL